MCGIYCYIKNEKIDESEQEAFRDRFERLKHRGPDNTVIKYIENEEHNIIMGFHRLRINGLDESSNMPITRIQKFTKEIEGTEETEEIEGTYTIVCNGEIYNCPELIEKYGLELETSNDCEVILAMYLKQGLNTTLNILKGVFSFVIYTDDEIVIARDPVGVRPLYFGYSNKHPGLHVASEMKCFSDLDLKIIHVPPGMYWKSKESKFIPYWLPVRNIKSVVNNKEISNSILKKLIMESVKIRMVCDRKPIGVLISGGLDSSLIAGIMKKYTKDLISFSIGLEESPDLVYARKVADHLGTIHHEVKFTIDEAIESIRDVIYSLETYDITTIRASVPMYLLSKYISKNTDVKVILSGEGSDELFGGYLYFHNCEKARDFQEESERLIRDIHKYDVLRADRTTAAWGLELRVPFLDKELVRYTLSIKPEDKMVIDNTEKHLLRSLFHNENNIILNDVLERTKDGMSDAVGPSWVNGIKSFVDKEIKNKEFKTHRFKHNKPLTKEAYYYRKIFNELFPKREGILQEMWMPKWGEDTKDPSGRLVKPDSF